MKFPRIKLTVFHLSLGIAAIAILLFMATERLKGRRDRLLNIADNYARSGAEYRRNAHGNADMLRIGAWHTHMSHEFERAADHPWTIPPSSLSFPPKGWSPTPHQDASRP
jgi:hypothetical protein